MKKYCLNALAVLKECGPGQFGAVFTFLRMDFHRKFGHNLIISTWHGLDFFGNVIYCLENGTENLGEPKGEYKKNFEKLIEIGKNIQ